MLDSLSAQGYTGLLFNIKVFISKGKKRNWIYELRKCRCGNRLNDLAVIFYFFFVMNAYSLKEQNVPFHRRDDTLLPWRPKICVTMEIGTRPPWPKKKTFGFRVIKKRELHWRWSGRGWGSAGQHNMVNRSHSLESGDLSFFLNIFVVLIVCA